MTESVTTDSGPLSIMVDADSLPWVPFALEGTFFKLLHLNDDRGAATFILKIPKGCKADMHKHLATVEAYVLQGEFSYENEGYAKQGHYVLEPGGVVHEPIAEGNEDLILFVVAHGPVQGVEPDGTFGGVIDNDVIYQCAVDGGAAGHVKRH